MRDDPVTPFLASTQVWHAWWDHNSLIRSQTPISFYLISEVRPKKSDEEQIQHWWVQILQRKHISARQKYKTKTDIWRRADILFVAWTMASGRFCNSWPFKLICWQTVPSCFISLASFNFNYCWSEVRDIDFEYWKSIRHYFEACRGSHMKEVEGDLTCAYQLRICMWD